MNRFEGKVVVITGAGSGIGAGTAQRFLKEGAFVVLNGKEEFKLGETVAGIDASKWLISAGDVTDERYVKRLFADAVARFGKLDVLVNNAGAAAVAPFEKVTTKDWYAAMSTGLDSLYFCAREALPSLVKSKGCMVNLSAASGLGGDWGMSAFNAAKGGVTNLTRAFALEYGSKGVRVNAVAPSLIATGSNSEMLKNKKLMDAFLDRLPLRRPGTPADVAGVITFLASDDAAFVTGAIVPVDGGVTAASGQPNFLALV